jgi:EpsI family protein
MIVVWIIAYWPTSRALWGYWIFLGSQGVLVCALTIWLLWRARFRVAAAAVRPRLWALVPLVLCSMALLIFWKAGVQALELLLLPAVLLLGVFAAFGREVARVVAIPVLFLYFAMPGWNFLSVALQNLTLAVVRWVSPIIGLPSTVSGSTVSFPSGIAFEVTLACSGIGFLVQALAIAALLGELEQALLGRRLRLLAGAALLALVANWIRALAILQIGYSTNMRSSLASTEHLEFGYVLFVLALIAFVWIATRKAPPDRLPLSSPSESSLRWRAAYAAALLVLLLAPAVVAVFAHSMTRGPAEGLSFPAGRGGWRGPVTADDPSWRPRFVGAHVQRQVVYGDASGREVEVFGVGYDRQEQGSELVNEDNSLAGEQAKDASITGLIEGEGMRYLETTIVDQQGRQSVIWSFYDIGGRVFVVPLMSQLWYGLHSLKRAPYSALFAIRAACADTCTYARETLRSFVDQMGRDLAEAVFISEASRASLVTDSAPSKTPLSGALPR